MNNIEYIYGIVVKTKSDVSYFYLFKIGSFYLDDSSHAHIWPHLNQFHAMLFT